MLLPMRPAAAAGLLCLAPLASAQIIVGTGDDLQAAIDGAASGSIIEIHSDATFPGPLNFVASPAKDLSLVAGEGYAPVIDGGFDRAVLIEPSDKTTRFQGLTLTSTPANWSIQMVSPPLPAGETQKLVVEDCLLDSGLYVVHTGEGRVEVTVRESTIQNYSMNLTGYDGELDVLVRDSILEDLLISDKPLGDIQVAVEDTLITDRIQAYADSGPLDVSFLRCRVEGYLKSSKSTGSFLPESTFRAESTLFVGTDAPTSVAAVEVEEHAGLGGLDIELVSCTLTGYSTGLELPTLALNQGDVVLRNTLFAENAQDVAGTLSQAVVESCLAEDNVLGSGSLLATAELDADFAPVPGSPGTDAGTSVGLALAPVDLYGNARIVDVDCDGVAEVNIGAVEAPPSLLATTVQVPEGNPVGTQTSRPVVGDTLDIAVQLGSAGVLGIVIVGQPLIAPLVIGGWGGALLIDPLTAQVYTTPTGLLAPALPLSLDLVGLPLWLQGARVEVAPVGTVVQFQNRVDLVLGY